MPPKQRITTIFAKLQLGKRTDNGGSGAPFFLVLNIVCVFSLSVFLLSIGGLYNNWKVFDESVTMALYIRCDFLNHYIPL